MAENKELTPEEVKALQDQNIKLAEELKEANEIIAKNAGLIGELNEKLSVQEKANEGLGKYPVLSHKGKKYELIDKKSRARFEGKNVIITADALKEDSKLLEHCIKKGYSCLREKGGK